MATAIVKGYKALQLTGEYIRTIIIRRPNSIQLARTEVPFIDIKLTEEIKFGLFYHGTNEIYDDDHPLIKLYNALIEQ